jgi:hypothetical protein
LDIPETAVARYAARISLWALCVSGGSLFVAACVFTLEFRRWFDEGVKLSMNVMADAEFWGGVRQDANTYVAVNVTNRGSASTTITHMVLFNYPSRLARWLPRQLTRRMKRQRPQTFVVTNPVMPGALGQLPYVLESGHTWMGIAKHTPELANMIEAGRLYVGIVSSHSGKTLFRRVQRWKPPKDARAV